MLPDFGKISPPTARCISEFTVVTKAQLKVGKIEHSLAMRKAQPTIIEDYLEV